MQLAEEWDKIMSSNPCVYIYGAGSVGRKVLKLVRKSGVKVNNILVSDLDNNPIEIDGISIVLPEQVADKSLMVLVAVTDVYQEEILSHLDKLGFGNVVVAYKYSYLVDDNDGETSVTMLIGTTELLMCQYMWGGFNRYDTIVRLLAIESYFNENEYGMNLYRRMQFYRLNSEEYSMVAVRRFSRLIESVSSEGYQDNSEIIVDSRLQLFDGSHRLALAIYYNVPRIRIRIINRNIDVIFGREWFANLFTAEEVGLIERKLFSLEPQWAGLIKGILWPNARDYFDSIIKDIVQEYEVTNLCELKLTEEKFIRIVKDVYRMDSIAEWKIQTKIEHMLTPEKTYLVKCFDIKMNNPEFQIKKTKGLVSIKSEILKDKIRNKYKEKINNYYPDIIFHTADNYQQSSYLEKILCEADL